LASRSFVILVDIAVDRNEETHRDGRRTPISMAS
jgi:hypothetical protein